MQFDAHVQRLLEATVALVNTLTPGWDGGRSVGAPRGTERRRRVAAAIAGPGYQPSVTASGADALLDVAVAARRVIVALDTDRIDDAAAAVNVLLRETGARPQLDRDDNGWNLHFHGPRDTLARGWAAGIAAGLAMTIGSGLAGRLGVCEAPQCDRVYVDWSRNGTRRFCSPRCQSRVKAAAHRARVAAAREGDG